MRGRTNATNGGIFLNATTDTFEVASGNNIVAGDFVEYVYDTEYTSLEGSFTTKNYLVDSTTNLYIAIKETIPTLFTFDGETITVVGTYPYNASYLVKYSDTIYIASNTDAIYVLEVDVQNQSFNLIASKTGIGYINFRYDTDTFLCVIPTSSSNNGAIRVYNCSDLTNITLLKTNTNKTCNTPLCVYDGVMYCVYGATGSSYGRMYMFPYTINTSTGDVTQGTLIEIASTGSSASAVSSAVYPLSSKLLDDRFLIFGYRFTSYSSTAVWMCVYDFVQNAKVVDEFYQIDNKFVTSHYSSEIKDDGTIVICSPGASGEFRGFVLFKFDKTNLTLSILDYKESSVSDNRILDYQNNKYSIHHKGAYLPFEVSNNKLIVGELTDTVQQWQGSGNPMGVAKQSGTAGDTIEVYIPQVNS